MEILITGCERSGTKMLAKKLESDLGVTFVLENKHTIASFKYYQELQQWIKYKDDEVPLDKITRFEKHTLNEEINIDFLKWVKETYPNIKIYYIVRDGRNVVSSIISKEWGYSQTKENYRISLEDACKQWNVVIGETWDWVTKNCNIVRYEDICDIVSNPLDSNIYNLVTNKLRNNLIKTYYLSNSWYGK